MKKDETSDEARYVIPSIERAFKIIELMSKEPRSSTITEISKALGISKNSVFRILKTLLFHNYVVEINHQYRLSSKLLSVGYSSLCEVNLVEKAIDVMRELKHEAKETVLLGAMLDMEGFVLEQVLGSYEIKFAIDVGHRFYLHTAAPGKAMLAFLPEEEKNRILGAMEYPRFNDRTIQNEKEMRKVLKKVQEKGYAVDCAERIEGLNGLASPIFNYLNYPIAAIWITGPSYRMPEKDFENLGSIVKKYAEKISKRLGYDPHAEKAYIIKVMA